MSERTDYPPEKDDEQIDLYVVYLGPVWTKKNKRNFAYGVFGEGVPEVRVKISEAWLNDRRGLDVSWFTKLMTRGATPGQIWRIKASQDHKTWAIADSFLDRYLGQIDRSQNTKLLAMVRAITEARSSQKAAKRNFDLEALEPFKLAYRDALSHRARRIMLAQIIEYVTRK